MISPTPQHESAVPATTIIHPALPQIGAPIPAAADTADGRSGSDWAITLPSLPSMVSAARAYSRAVFTDTPIADAAQLIASELATNALRHIPDGGPYGWFSVHTTRAGGWGRIAVADPGNGRWRARKTHADEIEDYSRGLGIVGTLATRVGHSVTDAGQAMWAEITWTDSDPSGIPEHPR